MSVRASTLIGLVGDYDAGVPAHRAVPRARALAKSALGAPLEFRSLPTETIDGEAMLAPFDALWRVPASPYRSMEGALRAMICCCSSALAPSTSSRKSAAVAPRSVVANRPRW